MNILVYDIAAESGGATVILDNFYKKHKADKKNHYVYLLSTYQLKSTDNVTVINIPAIKKSWLNRLCFDFFCVKKYIHQYKIDEVISLQNIGIFGFRGKQTVYEHNALPFCEYRYKLTENRLMWIYQNVLGRLMIHSIRKATTVVVQTEWMKAAIVQHAKVNSEKIVVEFPGDVIPNGYTYRGKTNNRFFFPANAAPFKNHKLIFEAAKILHQNGINNFEIIFTLNGNESEHLRKIAESAKELGINILWKGTLAREQVFGLYEESVLIFPSYIETIGLPIYEAKCVGSPILVSDCAYARNIIGDYKDASLFAWDDAKALANLMNIYIE